MKARELEERFDAGEDVSEHVDWSRAQRPNQWERVNVDVPNWMVESVDREAHRVGVTRQALIKIWLAEKVAALENSADSGDR
mgnify:CR=1 FL=1